MDLSRMDLNALAILWQASDGNLAFKTQVEVEIQNRIANNTTFSIEYLFRVSMVGNHSLGINFIPTSDAYNNYGPNITVSLILEGEELATVVKNFSANPPINSYGNVKVNVLVRSNLTHEQVEMLRTDGFNTSNILGIIHL